MYNLRTVVAVLISVGVSLPFICQWEANDCNC